MRFTLENCKLTSIENTIKSSDSIITLETEVTEPVVGILLLNDGSKKLIEFVNDDDKKIGRLILTEKDLPHLQSAKFYVEIVNASFCAKSNVLTVKSDVSSIKLDIKKNVSNEYKELLERVISVEEKIKHLNLKSLLTTLNIVNKDLIEPGMIPVALDSNGNFIAQYPFSNHIIEVNGKRAANGAVIIDASMIKYKSNGKSIEKALDDITEAIVSVNNLVGELVENQKTIMHDINELDIRLSSHINDGII